MKTLSSSAAQSAQEHMQEQRQRLDRWLWHARLVKKRSEVASLIAHNLIQQSSLLPKQELKPATLIRIGDIYTVQQHHRVIRVKIVGIAISRLPASDIGKVYVCLAEIAHKKTVL